MAKLEVCWKCNSKLIILQAGAYQYNCDKHLHNIASKYLKITLKHKFVFHTQMVITASTNN